MANHMIGGVMGTTPGFYTNQPSITEDDDGEFVASYFRGVIDMNHILSRTLGRQLPQMATYRINYLQISVRNVNDVLDNDSALQIGGNVRYFMPTKHHVDALQLARTFARAEGSTEAGTGVYDVLATDKNYKGLRFGYDTDVDVHDASPDNTTAMSGNDFQLKKIFNVYDLVLGGGAPGNEGYDTSGAGQALWEKRTETAAQSIQFDCGYTNRERTMNFTGDDYDIFTPHARPFVWNAGYPGQEIPVLGGLLSIELTHSNTDGPGTAVTEDDYEMLVTIGVSGWEEF